MSAASAGLPRGFVVVLVVLGLLAIITGARQPAKTPAQRDSPGIIPATTLVAPSPDTAAVSSSPQSTRPSATPPPRPKAAQTPARPATDSMTRAPAWGGCIP
jgi:hypothetical protein